jgi:beta-N-acetylhexosaminidase
MDAEHLLKQMTLEEKVGQLFLLAFAGHRLDEARLLMEQHLVGGAYISNDNIPTPEAALNLTRELQSYASRTRLGIPLLLGCDQEGAWGVMIPGSSPGPGNMALGATHDPADAFRMYRVIGTELSAVGLNTLLAPCADCNSNPMNSIIGMRSFGEKPQLVGAMTAAAVRGAHEGGVISTVKHYPGHGDTRLDTHRGLPTVDRNREELYAIDLYPFTEGIHAGADIVMTAHIIFSALDAERPATLSPVILQDILRGEMRFDGVILSDSMNMGAMRKNYDPQVSAVQALKAGVDMIMLAEEHYDHNATHYVSQQLALLKAVTQAVETRELPVERINAAVRRILSLKGRLVSGNGSPSGKDADRQRLGVVGSVEHRQVELEAARHAVAVLRDRHGLVPLPEGRPVILVNTTARKSYEPLGSTRGIGPNQTIPAFDLFANELRQRRLISETWSAERVIEGGQTPILNEDAVVVAVTENYPLPGMDFDQSSQPEVIRLLMQSLSERLVVVALRDPYELRYLPELPTYLCAFSFRPSAAQAAAEVLCGEVSPHGHTPVSVPDVGLEV